MADEAPPVEQPAVAPAVDAAPAVPPPADAAPPAAGAAPAAEAPAPVAEAAAAVAEVPPPEPAVDDAPPDPRRRPPSLLEKAAAEGGEPAKDGADPAEAPADAPADAKPADQPAETKPEEKPAESGQEGDQPAAPEVQRLEPFAEYKYELPDVIQMSDDQRGQFHTAVEDARNGNIQSLVDMHRDALVAHNERLVQQQWDQFNTMVEGWQKETEADPEIGGQHWTGTQRRVAQLRDRFASRHERGSDGWKADMDRLNSVLTDTGVGNHPVLWRFLNNIADGLIESQAPGVVDPKPAPQPRQRGVKVLYDHERSQTINGRG